jgi:DNA-binding MarR family transcriptional regulator
VAHPGDARAVLLDVTPAGRRLHDRIRNDRIGELTRLLADFPPDVSTGVSEVMRRLANATRDRMACAVKPARRSA